MWTGMTEVDKPRPSARTVLAGLNLHTAVNTTERLLLTDFWVILYNSDI